MSKINKHTSNTHSAPDHRSGAKRVVTAPLGNQGDMARRAVLLKATSNYPTKELNPEFEPGYN